MVVLGFVIRPMRWRMNVNKMDDRTLLPPLHPTLMSSNPSQDGAPQPAPRSIITRIRGSLPSPPTSGSIIRLLTSTQNCSALVFSVFLGVHLVSPIAATLGGTSLADNTLVRPLLSSHNHCVVYMLISSSLGEHTIYPAKQSPSTSP